MTFALPIVGVTVGGGENGHGKYNFSYEVLQSVPQVVLQLVTSAILEHPHLQICQKITFHKQR